MTTLAKLKQLENGEPELREAGYRRLRATCVLAEHSKTVVDRQDSKLTNALARIRKENFDFERVPVRQLEYVYGIFDEKLTDAITAEFVFVPRFGNIRNLGALEGHCELCGKGDSLEHRENLDKLRYEFRLQNDAGGRDIWVGSSCILQHGLHVDGGRTAEEAERILKKSFSQHKTQWEIESWRRENPDHFEIPDQWQALRSHYRANRYPNEFWVKVGLTSEKVLNKWYALCGANKDRKRDHFKGAARQYQTRGGLTHGKHQAWQDAQKFLKLSELLTPIFQEVQQQYYCSRWSVPAAALDLLDERLKTVKRSASFKEALSVFAS